MSEPSTLTEDELAQLRLLLESVIGLGSDLDTDSVQRRLVRAACEVSGAREGRLEVLEPGGAVIRVVGPEPGPGPLLTREVRVGDRLLARLAVFDREGEFDDFDQRRVDAVVQMASYALRNAELHAGSERLRRGLEAAMEVSHALSTADPTEVLETITGTLRRVLGAERVSLLGPGETEADAGALVVPVQPELAPLHHLVVRFASDAPPPSDEDQALVSTFADQAATALDRGLAARDREQLALVSERGRIARDLHDVVIQRLYATGLQLRLRLRRGTPEELQATVSQTVTELDATIRDIRSTIFALRREGSASLRADVEALVEEYAAALGFAPRVRVEGALESAPEIVAAHLLATLREALANVARHAAAGSARVQVSVDQGWLQLEVTDDGRGMGEAVAHGGLHNLLHRAQALGGTSVWDRGPSGGTTLLWRVPLSG